MRDGVDNVFWEGCSKREFIWVSWCKICFCIPAIFCTTASRSVTLYSSSILYCAAVGVSIKKYTIISCNKVVDNAVLQCKHTYLVAGNSNSKLKQYCWRRRKRVVCGDGGELKYWGGEQLMEMVVETGKDWLGVMMEKRREMG